MGYKLFSNSRHLEGQIDRRNKRNGVIFGTLICEKDSVSSTHVVQVPIHLCALESGEIRCDIVGSLGILLLGEVHLKEEPMNKFSNLDSQV